MAKMTKIQKVQKAIDIQGYVTVSVGGRQIKAKKISIVGGEWVTDIPTDDLCGYVRIRKTKDDLVAQAERIIAREHEILAENAAKSAATSEWMMRS